MFTLRKIIKFVKLMIISLLRLEISIPKPKKLNRNFLYFHFFCTPLKFDMEKYQIKVI